MTVSESTLSADDRRDLRSAMRALDRIADRYGDDWDDEEWDHISNARALIREFLGRKAVIQ